MPLRLKDKKLRRPHAELARPDYRAGHAAVS
jgi:hypothetical protein